MAINAFPLFLTLIFYKLYYFKTFPYTVYPTNSNACINTNTNSIKFGKNITNSFKESPYPDHKKQQGKFKIIENGFNNDLSRFFIDFNFLKIYI